MLKVSFLASYFYSNTQRWETAGTGKQEGAGQAKGEQEQHSHCAAVSIFCLFQSLQEMGLCWIWNWGFFL